jgi:hypothetical protein
MSDMNNEININILNKKLEVKMHLEKLLNLLLNDYVENIVENDFGFKFKQKDEKFHVISSLISHKIKMLTKYSIKIISDHINYQLKYLNTNTTTNQK